MWAKPFSFKGCIGRGELWLTLLLINVAGFAVGAIPVTRHHVVLSTYGGEEISSVDYATPLEPVTAGSWALLIVFYLLVTLLFWIMVAAMVKRLHDLGRSGKWVAILIGVFAVSIAIEAIFSRHGPAHSIADIISLALFVPVCGLGCFGLIEMLLIRGRSSWRTPIS